MHEQSVMEEATPTVLHQIVLLINICFPGIPIPVQYDRLLQLVIFIISQMPSNFLSSAASVTSAALCVRVTCIAAVITKNAGGL